MFLPYYCICFFIDKELVLTVVTTCRISVSNGRWETLDGKFSLSTMPDRVVFYLEGPSPGVDILIKSVVISSSSPKECQVLIVPFLASSEVYMEALERGSNEVLFMEEVCSDCFQVFLK